MVADDGTGVAHLVFVAVGEAEFAFLALINRLEKGGDLSTVPNMRIPARSRYNKNLTAIVNRVAPFPDPAKIAKKDYELFDMAKIIEENNGCLGLPTSRGCPSNFTYFFNNDLVNHHLD